jgi:hypothetical protein
VHIDSEIISALVKKKVKARKRKRDPVDAVPSSNHDETHPSGRRPRRKSNDAELVAEKHSVFAGSERDVLHPEVHKAIPKFWERFTYSFDTNGVAVSVHMRRHRVDTVVPSSSAAAGRGHWCPRTTRWVAAYQLPAHGLFVSVEDFRQRLGGAVPARTPASSGSIPV